MTYKMPICEWRVNDKSFFVEDYYHVCIPVSTRKQAKYIQKQISYISYILKLKKLKGGKTKCGNTK